MRGDLQVDKGNGVGWGFAERGLCFSHQLQRGAGLILKKAGMEGTCVVSNSKNSEKTKQKHPCSILFDAAAIRGQARLSGPDDPAGRGLNWHRHIRAGNQGHRWLEDTREPWAIGTLFLMQTPT